MHYRSQTCWELLPPFAHHCQHARNNSQHCWRTGRPPSVSGGRCWLKSEQRSFVIYRRNTYEQYSGYNLFQNAEFKANFNKNLKKVLNESCVMFFSSSHAVLSTILWDEYLTSAVRTKEGDKAGSSQPLARDPVQFKLELTPNYLISYLDNARYRSTGYVSIPHPNESSILSKCLEKSDPEVARPAFSTWPVQKSQPKAFEVCASNQIQQSAYRDRWRAVQNHNPARHRDDWWIWIDALL